MDNNIDISVLICTYNQERFIASAIESALAQQCEARFEILIGDDCSTDHTREVVRPYYENNAERIRLVYPETNIGSTGNFLNLVSEAKGTYLAILDGDDMWLDDHKLQKQLEVMRRNAEVGLVCSFAKKWNEEKKCYDGVLGDDSVEDFAKMVMDDSDVAAPTLFIRKSLFEKCVSASEWYIRNKCFFDTIIAYWFAYHSKIVFLPEELAMYRVLRNSGCHTSDKLKQREYDKRYFAIKSRFLLENNVPETIAHTVLLKEWDKAYDNAAWRKENEVRDSKSYRLGHKVIGLFGELKKQ